MAIDREVFAAVCLIAVFALFCDVSMKHRASAQSPVCQNFATGCPETTSTQSQGHSINIVYVNNFYILNFVNNISSIIESSAK